MVERLAEDNVIDNREIKLKDALNDILPHIKTVDIAVGYFYLSGLSQVIDTLEKVGKIRLLLSPTLDNDTVESLYEVYQDPEKAKEKFQDKYFKYNFYGIIPGAAIYIMGYIGSKIKLGHGEKVIKHSEMKEPKLLLWDQDEIEAAIKVYNRLIEP